ncbi:unnamed protein product [Spodoptera exigua]|nr:unnamed protein product [Spodoptera exigua]
MARSFKTHPLCDGDENVFAWDDGEQMQLVSSRTIPQFYSTLLVVYVKEIENICNCWFVVLSCFKRLVTCHLMIDKAATFVETAFERIKHKSIDIGQSSWAGGVPREGGARAQFASCVRRRGNCPTGDYPLPFLTLPVNTQTCYLFTNFH